MRRNSFPLLILVVAAVPFVGCMESNQPRPSATTQPPAIVPQVHIALLGDRTRIELLAQLAAASNVTEHIEPEIANVVAGIKDRQVRMATSKSDNLATLAAVCSDTNLAVIAVDARNGPMPVHREHILFARQMHIPAILVAFTHTDAIDDPELLELEELEMRELLNAYDWNGDEAVVAFDSERARVEHAKGVVMGALALSGQFSQAPERSTPAPVVKSDECIIEVYALAEQEAFSLKTSGVSSGEYTVVLGKSTPTARVQSTSTIAPGTTGSVTVTFDSPQDICHGQRCAILAADHVIAVGTIASTGPRQQQTIRDK